MLLLFQIYCFPASTVPVIPDTEGGRTTLLGPSTATAVLASTFAPASSAASTLLLLSS